MTHKPTAINEPIEEEHRTFNEPVMLVVVVVVGGEEETVFHRSVFTVRLKELHKTRGINHKNVTSQPVHDLPLFSRSNSQPVVSHSNPRRATVLERMKH